MRAADEMTAEYISSLEAEIQSYLEDLAELTIENAALKAALNRAVATE